MIKEFKICITELEHLFSLLEEKIDKPIRVPYGKWYVFRYKDKTIEVVLIQKLARIITGLQSALKLLESGYFQEVAVMQRVLDDIDEEILFLAYGKIMDTWGDTHKKYLNGFFSETFLDPNDPKTALDVSRPFVSRKKIRMCIDQSMEKMRENGGKIDANMSESSHIVSKVFNGFIHAGSPQILEMYGGNPPHYHLKGMMGTPREKENTQSLWNQFFRGTLAFELVCTYFKDGDLVQIAHRIHEEIKVLGN